MEQFWVGIMYFGQSMGISAPTPTPHPHTTPTPHTPLQLKKISKTLDFRVMIYRWNDLALVINKG